jgi:hypothetical protein
MALTNLKTVLTKTAKVTGVKLAAPADRIGLGFGIGSTTAYPTDSLSQGRFPAPRNPEPEQFRSRHGQSATQMRKHMRTGTPGAVPPASLAGCLPPGSSADRVLWSLTVGASWSVSATDPSRNRFPRACVRLRQDRDCQSPVRSDEKHALTQGTAPAATAGK